MRIINYTLFFFAFHFAKGQKLLVLDKQTQNPIEWVGVKGEGANNLYLMTDKKGEVDISEFEENSEIEIAHVSYQKIITSVQHLRETDFKIFLEPDVITMDEVVVSATRWQQDKKELSFRIVSISNQNIQLNNPQTMADLLALSGEVFVQKSQQGGGSPMIRGFSTNRLIYSVDGVRMNNAIFRGGNIQNVISLDPFAMQRTEVLMGPGSVIYGSDAIGGVMSFATLKPVYADSAAVVVSGKSVLRTSSANQERTAHLDLNIGFKNWALVSSFSKHMFGDLKMGSNGPDDYLRKFYVQRMDSVDRVIENENPLVQKPTAYDQINLMQKVAWRPNKHLEMVYAFHLSETSAYSRYDRLIETNPNNGRPISAVWNYGPQKWMMNMLTLDYSKPTAIFDKISTKLSLQNLEESRIDRNFSGNNRNRLRATQENVEAISVNVDLLKLWGKTSLMYGLEWVNNEVFSKGRAVNISNNAPIAVPSRYPRSKWNSAAIYVHVQRKLSKQVNLMAGTRVSQFGLKADFSHNAAFYPLSTESTQINNSAITGHLGAILNPNDKTQISIQASTAFRAPNVDDMGKIFDFGPNETVVPNPNLNAEYAYNLELNLNKQIFGFLKIETSVYHIWLENALVRRPMLVNGSDSLVINNEKKKIFAIQNASKATVYGFHFGFEIKLGKGFDLNSKVNYQRGREEMDNGSISPSRHAAPTFGITSLNFKKGKVNLSLNAVYSAAVSHQNLNEEEKQKRFIYAKDAQGNSFSPSWVIYNFKAKVQLDPIFSVSAGVENLTDLRYRPYSSGIVAPGRNFVISAIAEF